MIFDIANLTNLVKQAIELIYDLLTPPIVMGVYPENLRPELLTRFIVVRKPFERWLHPFDKLIICVLRTAADEGGCDLIIGKDAPIYQLFDITKDTPTRMEKYEEGNTFIDDTHHD
jgi:hypothetical protein